MTELPQSPLPSDTLPPGRPSLFQQGHTSYGASLQSTGAIPTQTTTRTWKQFPVTVNWTDMDTF